MNLSLLLHLLELLVLTTCLSLSLYSFPDTCRTALWEYGGRQGWNSNPQDRIYFYANHREPPHIPPIWSQASTDSNLATSLLALFLWIARTTMIYFRVHSAWTHLVYDLALAAFWVLNIRTQISGDNTDPEHSCHLPWYFGKSCSGIPHYERSCCVLGRAFFVFSILALLCHPIRLLWMIKIRIRLREPEYFACRPTWADEDPNEPIRILNLPWSISEPCGGRYLE